MRSGKIYVEHKNYGFDFEVKGDFLQLKSATVYKKKRVIVALYL